MSRSFSGRITIGFQEIEQAEAFTDEEEEDMRSGRPTPVMGVKRAGRGVDLVQRRLPANARESLPYLYREGLRPVTKEDTDESMKPRRLRCCFRACSRTPVRLSTQYDTSGRSVRPSVDTVSLLHCI